jgi:hypothetical protein
MPAKVLERIGFAIRDARGRSAAFHIDPADRQALVFGAKSAVRLEGKGVLDAHFVVLPTDFGLVVATADERSPAVLDGQPMPVAWTNLEIPARIRVGTALIDFFYVRESGVQLIDQDVEATVCETRTRREVPVVKPVTQPKTELIARPVPAPPSRPPAALAGPTEPPPRGPAAIVVRVRSLWASTPISSRILLGLVAVLLVIVVAR